MVPTRGFQIGKSNSLGDFRSRKEERPGSGSWGRERKNWCGGEEEVKNSVLQKKPPEQSHTFDSPTTPAGQLWQG